MFVRNFNSVEKQCFAELLLIMAHVDGEYSEEEKDLLDKYRYEMNLETLPNITRAVNDITTDLLKSEDTVKNAIYFELCVLARADNKVDETETHLLSTLSQKLSISHDKVNQLEKAVNQLSDAYDAVSNAIFD